VAERGARPPLATVVKVGSSTLVDDAGRPRRDAFARAAADCLALRERGTPPVLVSSGAVALGLGAVGRSHRRERVDELQAASALGQALLQDEWQRAFGAVRAAQVLLTLDDVARRNSYVNARRTLRKLVLWGVIPVVNENDSVATEDVTFGCNDRLAAHVAVMLHARLLVLLSDVDGVYDRDPREPGARLLREVAPGDAAAVAAGAGDRRGWGSGGMRSKVLAAAMAAECGVAAVVASGAEPGVVRRAAAGAAVGTRFRPSDRPAPAYKLWLRYGSPPRGRLVCDEGARRAVAQAGTSLLPVGLTDVQGRFVAGDAVELVGQDGEPFAVGVSRYAFDELTGLVGRRGAREVVRRDNLVLL
jgi:glutamate 5-kinase